MSPSSPLARLEHTGVALGAVTALSPLSLTLHRGERLAPVGANGSGKTTLLRLLHGLVPHSGRRLPGTVPHGAVPLVMAMLFQRPFALNLPVRFNLQLGLWRQGVAALPPSPASPVRPASTPRFVARALGRIAGTGRRSAPPTAACRRPVG